MLRFWNNDVLGNADGVHAVIASALLGGHPHPASPIEGEGSAKLKASRYAIRS